MYPESLAHYQTTLTRLARRHGLRQPALGQGIDFTSNDYLALADSPQLGHAVITALEEGTRIGSGGSRLLRGHHQQFEALEEDAVNFFKHDRTLYFGSGYTANMALLSALPRRGDLIIYDESIHASMRDGMTCGRAHTVSVRHNDIEQFRTAAQQWRRTGGKGRVWLVAESLYGMDGDEAPLQELFQLACQTDGFLMVDEAHATGVFGPNGRGLTACLGKQPNVITVHTCGKALGVAGALVNCNPIFYDYLFNYARTLIYSTAPPPLLAASVRAALKLLTDAPQYRQQLKERYQLANRLLHHLSVQKGPGSQIVPVPLGSNQRALKIAAHMQALGYDIRAIRPPTVPLGSARLRITITLHVSEQDIREMSGALSTLIEQFP